MPLDAVVADADVLLSAAIGKAAYRVFVEGKLRVHVSRFNAEEVTECLPILAGKYGLPLDLVELNWRLLPTTIHETSEYARRFKKALHDMRDRDPEDAHALALARALRLPLWSNDHHLEKLGVVVFTTAKLLKILEKRESGRDSIV